MAEIRAFGVCLLYVWRTSCWRDRNTKMSSYPGRYLISLYTVHFSKSTPSQRLEVECHVINHHFLTLQPKEWHMEQIKPQTYKSAKILRRHWSLRFRSDHEWKCQRDEGEEEVKRRRPKWLEMTSASLHPNQSWVHHHGSSQAPAKSDELKQAAWRADLVSAGLLNSVLQVKSQTKRNSEHLGRTHGSTIPFGAPTTKRLRRLNSRLEIAQKITVNVCSLQP